MTGTSKFSVYNGNYDAANVAPATNGSTQSTNFIAFTADESGTSSDPKLTVVHEAVGGGDAPVPRPKMIDSSQLFIPTAFAH